jgi:Transposase C of IS166 homeodomain
MSTEAPTCSPALPDDPVLLQQINRELLDLVAKQQAKIDGLQQQLDQLRRRLFGHKSEKVDPNQPLLFPELAAATPSDTALSPPPAANAAPAPKRRGHGRKGLNPKLRRDRRVYVLDENERRCPCGGLCEKFGEESSEQLDYVPAVSGHQPLRSYGTRSLTNEGGGSPARPGCLGCLTSTFFPVPEAGSSGHGCSTPRSCAANDPGSPPSSPRRRPGSPASPSPPCWS